MAQRREAPAFQEYAASMMARTEYRVMSLEGRGLLYTMRLECWVNRKLPADPAVLAKVVGQPVEEVKRALIEVQSFFVEQGAEYRCPELDDYRLHLEGRRMKQSDGGRVGAAKTNGARSKPDVANPTGNPRVASGSLVKTSSVQFSKAKGLDGEVTEDEWVNDYERASCGE
jgi:uncharacterized protein YdaU (DUF1376 family)